MNKQVWHVENSAEYGLHIVDANGVHVSPMEHAHLIAAAPDLLEELQSHIKNSEQAAFEDWLRVICPSGDVESVQRQWAASSLYDDFLYDTANARAAIAKALGEQQ